MSSSLFSKLSGAVSRSIVAGSLFVGTVAADAATVQAANPGSPGAASTIPVIAYRRLTESQYRHAITDVFGKGIEINARFEPELRESGLQAIGNSRLSVTTTGLEQYLTLARSIADQVVDGKDAATRIGCLLAEPKAAECAKEFIRTRGRVLFRRPLSEGEVAAYLSSYSRSVSASGQPAKGLKLAMIGMLMSPEFLFRVERAETDPGTPSALRLTGYTKAARLSYALWDAAPDDDLLESARTGSIHTPEELAKQVDRLLASPRLEDGVRAFFTDMLQFESFDTLSKDGATYPKFSQAVADSAREETLKFLVHLLVEKNGDYRDIFTSRETFLNRSLAAVYNVPYPSKEAWTPFEFSPSSERSGVLTQVTFLSLFSHPASSSPTVRGAKMYDIFLCTPLPLPPPDVDFSKVQATENGTVRSRLTEHRNNPSCSVCHNVSDPPGLALERFDGLGQFRTLENGQPIDVTAKMGNREFEGSLGLGAFMRDNRMAHQCLVRNVHGFASGRLTREQSYLDRHRNAFAQSGFKLSALLRSVLNDAEFYKVTLADDKPTGRTANADAPSNSGAAR